MREITTHYDGHGLNESIKIEADDADHSGASHQYVLTIGDVEIARIQYQKGPRNEEGSTPGATEAAILAVLADRLEGFQSGPYACHENDVALNHIKWALGTTAQRAHSRAQRGVLGTYAK